MYIFIHTVLYNKVFFNTQYWNENNASFYVFVTWKQELFEKWQIKNSKIAGYEAATNQKIWWCDSRKL